MIYLVMNCNQVYAGLLFGFVVHFRLYPVIYLPTLALYILLQPEDPSVHPEAMSLNVLSQQQFGQLYSNSISDEGLEVDSLCRLDKLRPLL